MARRLIKAAENHGDTTMPGVRDMSHCIYRWERDAVSPGERYRLFYCEALGITPHGFGVQTCETTSPPTIEVRGAVSIVITIDGDSTEISIAKLPVDSSIADGSYAEAG